MYHGSALYYLLARYIKEDDLPIPRDNPVVQIQMFANNAFAFDHLLSPGHFEK